MASRNQVVASRQNGRLGGPKTPEGKAVSRLNARRHGIFASALTRFDREELWAIHAELYDWLCPVGPLEEMLVEKLALTYLRMQPAVRRGAAEVAVHAGVVGLVERPDCETNLISPKSLQAGQLRPEEKGAHCS